MKRISTSGFTMVELLVVISIITLLISLLLPALRRARDVARAVTCRSQLRSHGLGFEYYMADYEEAYPYWSISDPDAPINPSLNTYWVQASASTMLNLAPARARALMWQNAFFGKNNDTIFPIAFCPSDPRLVPNANIQSSYVWSTKPRPGNSPDAATGWWGSVFSSRDSLGNEKTFNRLMVDEPDQTLILNEFYPGVPSAQRADVYHNGQAFYLMADYSVGVFRDFK